MSGPTCAAYHVAVAGKRVALGGLSDVHHKRGRTWNAGTNIPADWPWRSHPPWEICRDILKDIDSTSHGIGSLDALCGPTSDQRAR